MKKHPLHNGFAPVLYKLYQSRDSSEMIDISDCLTDDIARQEQIIQQLHKSKFVLLQLEDREFNTSSGVLTTKYSAKILPLGVAYYETHIGV